MAFKNKILSEQSYLELKQFGFVVPRDKKRYIDWSFKCGNSYTVSSENKKEKLNVVCSQENPPCIKLTNTNI